MFHWFTAKVKTDLSNPSRKVLADYVDERRERIRKIVNWYKTRAFWRRLLTVALRCAILAVLLYAGVILLRPADQGGTVKFLWLTFPSQGNAALAAAVIAVILIAANQVFMLSTSWTRYMLAKMDIEVKEQKFTGEWDKLSATLTDENAAAQRNAVIDLISGHLTDVWGVMRAETASWGADLAAAMQRLEQMVKDQRSATETLVKAADAARPTTSVVRVVIANYKNVSGPLTVTVAGKTASSPAPTPTLVVADVPTGGHAIELKYKDKTGAEQKLQDAVELEAGKVAVVDFQIP
jgi:hypothetical protein